MEMKNEYATKNNPYASAKDSNADNYVEMAPAPIEHDYSIKETKLEKRFTDIPFIAKDLVRRESLKDSESSTPPPLPTSPPPLPSSGPPPPLPSASSQPITVQQSFTSNSSVSTATGTSSTSQPQQRSPLHGTYSTYLVRQAKPYYNTSTQTEEVSAGGHQHGAPLKASQGVSTDDKPSQVECRSVQVQVNMDLMNHFASYTPISTLDRRRSIKSDMSIQCDPSFTTELTPRSTHVNTNLKNSDSDSSPQTPLSMSLPVTKEYPPFSRAPIVDKVETSFRIPDNKPERSQNTSKSTVQSQNDIMAHISEQATQNDTYLLRKLSQEFYGGHMKTGYAMPTRLGSVPERRAFQSSDSKLNQWASHSSHSSIDNKRASLDHYENRPQSSSDLSVHFTDDNNRTDSNDNLHISDLQSDAHKKTSPFDRSKKLSLKKAFGIFDEPESFEKLQAKLRSKSASQGSQNNENESVQRPIKAGIRNITGWVSNRNYEKLSTSRDGANRNYERLDTSRQEWGDVNSNSAESPKKLKRTSSEQLRPVKEKQREILREKSRALEAENAGDKRHKNSDPGQFHAEHFREISTDSGIDPNRRISDPNSEQALTEFKSPENRWSSDSDNVFAPPTKYHRRRDAHRRASSGYSTSSSIDDRHKTSDPEIKKLQQQAVMNFFEMKTKGKRMSSSSVESIGLADRVSPKERYSAGSPGGGWRDRSPSPLKGDGDRFTFSHPMVKSKSLPRDLLLAQMSDSTSDLDLDSIASGSMERHGRSNSAHKMDNNFYKSAPPVTGDKYSQLESYGLTSVDIPTVDNHRRSSSGATSSTAIGAPQHHRRSSSGTTDSSIPSTLKGSRSSECSTPPATLHERQSSNKSQDSDTGRMNLSELKDPDDTIVKTYEYSPSSSDTSPQAPSGGDFGKFGFKETVNVGYKESEEDSPPPPTLPPRNYRAGGNHGNRSSNHSSSGSMSGSGMERRPLPPLPQKPTSPQQQQTSMVQKQMTPYSGASSDMAQDFDSTPKADAYADQLRAQARRFSENQPRMLNAARYQSKPLPEMKTNIIKSRPVDGQPRPQEARPLSGSTTSSGSLHSPTSPTLEMSPPVTSPPGPQSLYRSSEFDRGLNFVGMAKENGAQISSSTDSITSPSASVANSSPSQLSSQDYNANNRHKLDSVSPTDSANTQVSSPGRRHSDYHSDALPVVVRDRLLGSHNAMETPELPPPPTPLTGENTSGLMDDTFTPPPMPSPLDQSDELRKRRSVDEEGTPNRYSNDSYMQTRGNVRQGFGGNYRRNVEPNKPPSPPTTQPPYNTEQQQPGYPPQPAPRGAGTMATNPPPVETVVKVATVMTVTKSLPSAEQKVQIEQGPRVVSPTAELQHHPGYGSHSNDHSNMSSPPESNRSVQQTEEQSQSPSVRQMLTNFQNSKAQPWTSRRPLEPTSNYQPVPRTKVNQLKESLMRLSNENLNEIDSDHISPSHSMENISKRTYSKPVVPPMYSSQNQVVPSERTEFSESRDTSGLLPQNGDALSQTINVQDNRNQSHQPMNSDLTNGASLDSSSDLEGSTSSSKVEDQKSEHPMRLHQRQKSQEEIDYEKQAALVAQRLKDEDRRLCEVIQPPPDHKTTTDFMMGIFDTKVDLKRNPSLLRKTVSASTVRRRSQSSISPERRLNSSLPNSSTSWSPLGAETIYIQGSSMPLDQQKEELQNKIERKLEILKDEKELIDSEIDENNQLGKELNSVVETKCQNKGEYDKYKLYVDELDKVMYLLLKLSGRLARAQNAVLSLSEDASEKQRSMLTTTRDQIQEKHDDAKSLKEGIDRRSKAVAVYLRKYLTGEEYADYEYFIKMKSKLTMESQEIEDKIKLGEEQLRELRKSMTSSQS